ncbi:hypothetical protein IV102_05500 [bacterium]|nr:hypothetical protein [bacterium]
MRNWLILLVSSVTTFGCGSTQFQDFIQNGSAVNPTGLVISPKPVNRLVGQTQQFVAMANFDNGTTADVTGLVQWFHCQSGCGDHRRHHGSVYRPVARPGHHYRTIRLF